MRRQQPNLSKDFKKQLVVDEESKLDLSRLSELRMKLEKDKEMMKTTTGRRFKDADARSSNSSFSSNTKGSQQPQSSKKILSQEKMMRETPKQLTGLPQKKSMAIGTKPPTAQRISLNQLKQQPQQSELDSLRSSNTFEREKDKQKKNNREVFDLLRSVKLQQFYDSFIDEGFDDKQSLTELDTDALNRMKMKASHQRVLMEEIKKKMGSSTSVGTELNDPEICRSYISSRNRIQTQPQMSYKLSTASSATLKTINTSQRPKPKPLGQMSNSRSSFLYSAGGSEFSLVPLAEPLVRERKACCYCFKITLEPLASGYFYYCSKQCILADKRPARKLSPTRNKYSETASQRPYTDAPARGQPETDDLDFSRLTLTNSMIHQFD